MQLSFIDKVSRYFTAAYPFLWVQTFEEQRVIQLINRSPFTANKVLYTWDTTFGFRRYEPNEEEGGKKEEYLPNTNKLQALVSSLFAFTNVLKYPKHEQGAVVILKDLHPHMTETNPVFVRDLRNIAESIKTSAGKMIVIYLSPVQKIPVELQKVFQFVDFDLPTGEQLGASLDFIIRSYANSNGKKDGVIELSEEIHTAAIDAAKGMTQVEAEDAFSLAIISYPDLKEDFVKTIFNEKIEKLGNTSFLSYIKPDVSFNNVGGLNGIKKWIKVRSKGFLPGARVFGLPYPKGILLAGVPGTGKTLIAKAVASELRTPLFQLDVGGLFSKYVGETEQNFRQVIKTLDAIGPCTLLIDEFEKSFNKDATSGKSDSGTSSRSFGSFLTWMSDRTTPVFIVATTNNYLILPPELIRKGRFDELWWVDMPNNEERSDIVEVVLKKYSRDPAKFKVKDIVNKSVGYTGAEIEQAVLAAMFMTFAAENGKKDIQTADIIRELKDIEPLSKVNAEDYKKMVESAEGKLRMATKMDQDETLTETYRKLGL